MLQDFLEFNWRTCNVKIIFVMGPSCGGKSTFIKNNFPEYKKLDLYDYEEKNGFSIPAIIQSYDEIKEDLIDAIKNNEDIVMEHTLLKAIRREVYIDAIKEVTDSPIIGYFILPSDEEIESNAKKRKVRLYEGELDNIRNILDIPTVDEGFAEVHIITQNQY